jgi:hypothetical protein
MIKVTADTIYVDNGTYSFEDIYKAVQDSNYKDKAQKIGSKSFFLILISI